MDKEEKKYRRRRCHHFNRWNTLNLGIKKDDEKKTTTITAFVLKLWAIESADCESEWNAVDASEWHEKK